jgi:hypothetical protein
MNAAKKIKSEFITHSKNVDDDEEELTEYLKKIPLDDLIRILPPGKIKIASSGKGKLGENH